MKMKSVVTPQQLFNHVAKPQIQRSTFDRSHGYKTTLDAGKLIPVFVDEALPGDTFNITTSMFGRLSTPLKPIMDNMFMDLHFLVFLCDLSGITGKNSMENKITQVILLAFLSLLLPPLLVVILRVLSMTIWDFLLKLQGFRIAHSF